MELHQWIYLILFLAVVILNIRQFFKLHKKGDKLNYDLRYNNLDPKEHKRALSTLRKTYLLKSFGNMLLFILAFVIGIIINLNFYRFT